MGGLHQEDKQSRLGSLRAVLFDWDGTLVDTLELLCASYNEVYRQFGMALWDIEDARANIRQAAREIFPSLFQDRAKDAEKIFYGHIDKYHLDLVRPMAGAAEFLARLHQEGIRMGVVSNKSDDLLRAEVEHLGWAPYFDAVIGANAGIKGKPAPDMIVHCLDVMGMDHGNLGSGDKQNILMIGDTNVDMQSAQNAGVVPVFIRHGFAGEEEIRDLNLTHNYADFEDILRHMD